MIKCRRNWLSHCYKAAEQFCSIYWHRTQNTDDSCGSLQHLSAVYELLESILYPGTQSWFISTEGTICNEWAQMEEVFSLKLLKFSLLALSTWKGSLERHLPTAPAMGVMFIFSLSSHLHYLEVGVGAYRDTEELMSVLVFTFTWSGTYSTFISKFVLK